MTSETTCPICQLEHIDEKQENCPQCDADLTCFRVLEALPETGVPPSEIPHEKPDRAAGASKKSMLLYLGAGLVGSLVIVLLGLQLYRIDDLTSRITTGQSALNTAITGIESRLGAIGAKQGKAIENVAMQIKSVNAHLQILSDGITNDGIAPPRIDGIAEPKEIIPPAKQLQSKESKPLKTSADWLANRFHHYQANDSDTLWWIADRFYGAGLYYPVILTHNPDLGIYTISSRSRIAILKDPSRVKEIYREITETESGRSYWRYTVRVGDTAASLTKRYCLLEACVAIPAATRSQTGLRPGQTIRIQLAGAPK